MYQMATDTDFKCLPVTMWLMAFHTVWDISMFVMMAVRTVKFTMGTGVVFHFTYLSWMAGITYCYIVLTENNTKGLVGVLVTS